MVIKSFADRILGIALGAGLMVSAVATASAQEGSFHLPVEVKWGGTVLPAGNYRMSLPDIARGVSSLLVQGPAGKCLILPSTIDSYGARHSAPQVKNYLELVNVDGQFFVKEFEEGSRSRTFFFRTPTPTRSVKMSENVTKLAVTGM